MILMRLLLTSNSLIFGDYNLCAELCMAADMQDEWNEASPGEVEKVVSAAAKKLGVQI